jgi:dipeptidyl aminopeptidase/acylaminoacyl peptidase
MAQNVMADKRRSSHYWRNVVLFTLGVVLIVTLALVVALSARWAHNYTHPARHPVSDDPADYGLTYESVSFPSADGLLLKGWFTLPEGEKGNGAAIILCHGYGGNRAGLAEAAILAQHGYNTLLFDFRGHGESEGDLVTLGYDEVQDVRGAVAYLQIRPEVTPDRIGLLGHSMGGATAIRAAARIPEIKAVVTEGAYASLADTIADDFSNLTGLPKFPFASLMVTLGQWQTGLEIERVQPLDDVARISPRPVLLIHGLADSVIPPENGRRLYEAAGEPKALWQPEGVGHAAAARQRPDEFEARVVAFFDQALLSD